MKMSNKAIKSRMVRARHEEAGTQPIPVSSLSHLAVCLWVGHVVEVLAGGDERDAD